MKYFLSQIYYFSPAVDDGTRTFRPLEQNKHSNQKYNGPGLHWCIIFHYSAGGGRGWKDKLCFWE